MTKSISTRRENKCWIAAGSALAFLFTACGGSSVAETSATTTPIAASTAVVLKETTTTDVAVPTTEAVEREADPTEGLPEGMPTEYAGRILEVDPNRPPEPRAGGGFKVTLLGPVIAEDGTIANLKLAVFDYRTAGGSVECGGETHDGPYTGANNQSSKGAISVDGWGKANIRVESTAHAFDAQLGAPFCDEQMGTWTGVEGELEGRTGTFHRLMVGGEEVFTLG